MSTSRTRSTAACRRHSRHGPGPRHQRGPASVSTWTADELGRNRLGRRSPDHVLPDPRTAVPGLEHPPRTTVLALDQLGCWSRPQPSPCRRLVGVAVLRVADRPAMASRQSHQRGSTPRDRRGDRANVRGRSNPDATVDGISADIDRDVLTSRVGPSHAEDRTNMVQDAGIERPVGGAAAFDVSTVPRAPPSTSCIMRAQVHRRNML